MKNKLLMPYNLQFFAEGADSGEGNPDDEGAGEGTDNQGAAGDQNQGGQDNGSKSGETFTQEQMNAIAAREKSQGKNSILKMFGVKDEKTAKAQAEEFKKWQEAQKDTEQKLKDSEATAKDAESRATAAERKLSCVMAGVQKESIDDVLAIASAKVTDDKDLDAVLEEMKKEPKYKGFFGTGSSGGTGSSAEHKGGAGTGGTENIGARLGKAKSAEPQKSAFFAN